LLVVWASAEATNTASHATPELAYRLTERIAAPDALWDYASVSAERRRLYIGQAGGILILDLASGKPLPRVVTNEFVHGAAPLDRGRLATSNAYAKSVTVIDEGSGHIVGTVTFNEAPDAIIFDPYSKLILTTNPSSQSIQLIDANAVRSIGNIRLPGRPEYFASDGHGLVFANIVDKNVLAFIDIATRKVIRTIPLPRCQSPTGLAFDAMDDLTISVCENGTLLFLDAKSGDVRQALKVGAGADAVIFDSVRRRVFVPSGEDGVLTVIHVRNAHDCRVEQRLKTEPGTRTGAVDPLTGRVYLPAANVLPPKKDGEYPEIEPGSFHILVAAPYDSRDSYPRGR
jgi:DNA-binding beta-propeller fold protein YncE